jgi:hypothetical protein
LTHAQSSSPDFDVSNNFLKLVGAFVSEGSVNFRRRNNKVKAIRIYQTTNGNPKFFRMMKEISTEIPLNRYTYNREEKGLKETIWILTEPKLRNELFQLCGHGSRYKRLPSWFTKLSCPQANILLDALTLGDGTQKNKYTRVYYTSSKLLADDVQALALLAGKEVSIVDSGLCQKPKMYQVSYRVDNIGPRALAFNPKMKKHRRRLHNKKDNRGGHIINYEGNIVCFSVPNEILVTRLNGKTAMQGNTKFASNLIQLLMEGIELMNTGRIQMPLVYRLPILDIKNGKYSVEEIMEWADVLVEEARAAYEISKLPAEPRSKEIEAFAIEEVKAFLMASHF